MAIAPVPQNHQSLSPYLIVSGGQRALDFYQRAFGATELMRLEMPGGRIGHAELLLEGCVIMLADECAEAGAVSPESGNASSVFLHVYLADVDARFAQAIAAGAKVVREVKDQFYGDRSGTLMDPFGHQWTLATHQEDLTSDEIGRRMNSLKRPEA